MPRVVMSKRTTVLLGDAVRAVLHTPDADGFYTYPPGVSDTTIAADMSVGGVVVNADHVAGMRRSLDLNLRAARYGSSVMADDISQLREEVMALREEVMLFSDEVKALKGSLDLVANDHATFAANMNRQMKDQAIATKNVEERVGRIGSVRKGA